ncbi:hypothetical protein GQ44DRAFT_776862 [Phaeosphaeriaceae sp. PMI808]|nr:hypothetical protein GQ44DRAFT_776862 [Phaeosphaeriaceae sp. PMI808]
MSDLREEGDYWSLLESTQQQQYPEFVKHLSKQNYLGEKKEKRPHLRRCLNEPHPTGAVRRRVFVLEELPRNHIQILGAKLKAPPDFFASHWACLESIIGNLLNRTPRHYDSQNRFILTFPRLHRARIKALDGDYPHPYYRMETSIHRLLSRMTVFGDLDGPLTSFEQLSFWSTCNGESWDAILLVDPPLGNFVKWNGSLREVDRDNSIKLVDSVMEGLNQRGSWYPSFTSAAVLGSKSADWKNTENSPGMESMFEDILLLYPLTEYPLTADSNSCMDVCRRMVLSAWTARLRIAEAQIIQEQCIMSIGNMITGNGVADLLEKSWARPWDPRDFGRLVRAKSALESIDWELYRNMDALKISKALTTEAWEADAWMSIQKVVQTLKTRLDIISQAYMQAVSVRESVTANKQAQQVGYLTSLATLFIPLSFVAAVFSMGGDFSAGASHFWVYWIIAVPVAVVACFLLFTKHGRRIVGNVSGEQSLVQG